MAQENQSRDERVMLILGTTRGNEQDNFFSKINRFHLL